MKLRYALIINLLLFALSIPALAQEPEPELQLGLSRTFGYGGIGQIQGTFTFKIRYEGELRYVEFLIDDQVVAVDREAPFQHRFSTGEYADGAHTMSARGYTPTGETLTSNAITREFLSAEAAYGSTIKLIGPLLLGIGLLTLASAAIPILLGRRGSFRPGVYGITGGAVCPKCAKPFSRHIWSPNLFTGKLERCPHCRKWSLVRRATAEELQAAEALLTAETAPTALDRESESERLRKLIDESRYED